MELIQSLEENKQDITRNLPSLTFESALDEDELSLLHLRQYSHAHSIVTCASVSFLASILNEARQIRADLSKPTKQRRAIQLLTADFIPSDPCNIGLIGCGRIGTHVANCLLDFAEVNPKNLFISTRRPELLGELISRGVSVGFNNPDVASKVHLLIICVLPCQLAELTEEIKTHLKQDTIVYCLVNNMTAKKLGRTLGTTHIIVPVITFNQRTVKSWNNYMSVDQALQNMEVVTKCCPLTQNGKDACAHLSIKWVEIIICAFVNMCTNLGLSSEAALDLLHGVCLGINNYKSVKERFTELDFIINWNTEETNRSFPLFDLTKLHYNDSHVMKKLVSSPDLQKAFSEKFISVYQTLLNQKNYELADDSRK